jgi:hypothetical protein
VVINVKGGGATFGKTDIVEGHGEISGVRSIDEIFGSYAAAAAHAGVVKTGDLQAMTKGKVSLALAGHGKGVDIGPRLLKVHDREGRCDDRAPSSQQVTDISVSWFRASGAEWLRTRFYVQRGVFPEVDPNPVGR